MAEAGGIGGEGGVSRPSVRVGLRYLAVHAGFPGVIAARKAIKSRRNPIRLLSRATPTRGSARHARRPRVSPRPEVVRWLETADEEHLALIAVGEGAYELTEGQREGVR